MKTRLKGQDKKKGLTKANKTKNPYQIAED